MIPEYLPKKLLLKSMAEVEISFNDVMYLDSVAMGLPLGMLANIFGFLRIKS